jgi:hypothetical protein
VRLGKLNWKLSRGEGKLPEGEKRRGDLLFRMSPPLPIFRRSGSASRSQPIAPSELRNSVGPKPELLSHSVVAPVVRTIYVPPLGIQFPDCFASTVAGSQDGHSSLSSSGRSLFRWFESYRRSTGRPVPSTHFVMWKWRQVMWESWLVALLVPQCHHRFHAGGAARWNHRCEQRCNAQ